MPAFQFDEQIASPKLKNYWGSQPVLPSRPHSGYSPRKDPPGSARRVPRDGSRPAPRRAEVILDGFNHTAEAARGADACFRGFDNDAWSYLRKTARRRITPGREHLNTNRPVVRRLILDSLAYWAEEMHVDGFRFDLASTLSQCDEAGRRWLPVVIWDRNRPALVRRSRSPSAWDAAGLYQVGSCRRRLEGMNGKLS
jgi:glycogen operon protein